MKNVSSNARKSAATKTVSQPEEVKNDEVVSGSEEKTPEVAVEATSDQPAPVVDPFADLPLVTIGDYDFRDLTTVTVSEPRKYEGVHRSATEAKAHMKAGWKHSDAMITKGTAHRDFKPGSVYGTIQQIVQSYGRSGVPAYVLVAKVRQAQIGNKRSHYCEKLPPIGWAEGWIDTFVSKNFGKVMATKAPPMTAEDRAEIAEGDKEALRSAA